MSVQTITTLLKKLKKCFIPSDRNSFPLIGCVAALLENLRIILNGASTWWQQYAFIINLLKCSRVTLFILIFAAAFLSIPNSQGQELTIRLSNSLTYSLIFLFGVLLWAFQAWIGTRKILDEIEDPSNYRRKAQPNDNATASPRQEMQGHGVWAACKACCANSVKSERWWIDHWPRILGMFVYIISTVALFLPVGKGRIALFSLHGVIIAANVAIGVAFYYFLIKRRKLIQDKLGDIELEQSSHLLALDKLHLGSRYITIAYITLLFLLATFAPVWLGFTFGAAGIAVLGFSSVTATGNFIIRSIVLDDNKKDYGTATQFPVLTVLFAVAVGFSFFNDNHGVRLLSGDRVVRPKLDDFAEQWYKQGANTNSQAPRPMIFVATAGGGIRATHWTAAVLTQLTDSNPKFADSVFAISSVSGGSVGASVYNALIKEAPACGPDSGNDCRQKTAKKLLSQDFLGPTLSALLFNDMLQRFLPIGFLPDRQKALEKGWEKAWEAVLGNGTSGGLAAPYSSSWNKAGGADKWLPLLLLNSTHMETGKKVITSPFLLDTDYFLDDVDLIQLLDGKDMPLSAAAGNSARFTYVSPPGTLPYSGGFFEFSKDNGHLIDGGYFENNGAITLLELLRALQSKKADDNKSFFERHSIKPVVILITNDNNLVCEKNNSDSVECFEDVFIKPQNPIADKAPAITDFNGKFLRLTDNNGANETLAPILGLLKTRDGHAVAATKDLKAWVDRCQKSPADCNLSENTKPEFFHFRIDLKEGEFPPALGWVLSKDSEDLIWKKIESSEHNKTAQDEILKILGGI